MNVGRLFVLLSVLSLAAAPAASAGEKKGSLVIIGGAQRFADAAVWSRIVELAGGKGAKIAVFPTANSHPQKSGGRSVGVLNQYGADAFTVPVAILESEVDYRQAVADPELVARVNAAGGVFFVGGEQKRIMQALVTEDGRNTPLLEAVWDVYNRGGVIAGTSAGAAVMSRVMFRGADSVLATMQDGVKMGQEIGPGLGFIDADWFVEQHCLTRGRFARALVAMHSQGLKYGIGVDENTALVVRDGDQIEVVGYKGAVVLDLAQAERDETTPRFNLRNVRLTYLDHGDAVNMRTLEVTPSQEKRAEVKIDPRSPSFHPYYDEPVFANDILGNTALVDLMCKLIDNRRDEATGLAFDGAAGRNERVPGFEFRFYRGPDSFGWNTQALGSDDYTIVNIHLDVKPIDIGPLISAEPAGE